MSEDANLNLFSSLHEMGTDLARNGMFDPDKLAALSQPECFSRHLVPIIKLAMDLPRTQSYWINQLKQNGVYEQRDTRPFIED